MRPHYSQSSREDATPSSGSFPLASCKGVPPPPRALIVHFNTNKPQSFFCRIPVVLEGCMGHLEVGGGGVCLSPRHPLPRSAPFRGWMLPFFHKETKCVVFDTNEPFRSLASFSRSYVTLLAIVFKLS